MLMIVWAHTIAFRSTGTVKTEYQKWSYILWRKMAIIASMPKKENFTPIMPLCVKGKFKFYAKDVVVLWPSSYASSLTQP